jgi:hypothetical protein
MNAEQFEQTLREYLRREPFQPFVVELVDGGVIAIDHPKVAIGGGGASFFTPSHDLVDFECENVRAIRPTIPKVTT